MSNIGTLGGAYGAAQAINDRGQSSAVAQEMTENRDTSTIQSSGLYRL